MHLFHEREREKKIISTDGRSIISEVFFCPDYCCAAIIRRDCIGRARAGYQGELYGSMEAASILSCTVYTFVLCTVRLDERYS